MPRLAPALEAFPTLRRFPAMRPRNLAQIPIGCRRSAIDAPTLQHGVLHLYYDLGVLVYAGCSPSQVTRIGVILRQVVSWGGIGGVVSMLDGQEGKRRSDESIKGGGLLDKLSVGSSGHIESSELSRRAVQRCDIILQGLKETLTPEYKDLITTSKYNDLPNVLPRGEIMHETVNGPRPLPIESFSSLYIARPPPGVLNSTDRRTVGETRFFTVGTGTYLGGALVEYVMWKGAKEECINPFWRLGKLEEKKEPSREVLGGIMERAMVPLWEMERQVWADEVEKGNEQ